MALAWDALKQKPGRNTLYNVNPKLTATHTCLESGAINHKPATYSSPIQAHTLGAVKDTESSFVSFLDTNCENVSTLTWGLGKPVSTKMDEFPENFRTAFDSPPRPFSENYIAIFSANWLRQH